MDPVLTRYVRRRSAPLLACGALVLAMSGCGDQPATTPDATPQSTPATSSSSSDARRAVTDRYISSDDLPGTWRDSDPPGAGFKQLVCDVDIEPKKPVNGGAVRFSQGGLGPFLAQHVRIHASAGTPAAVVNELSAALPDCASYETKGDKSGSPTVRFDVEPLTVTGLPDDAVAWRQTASSGKSVVTDMVLIADGDALVAFVSYGLQGPPDAKVLEQAVAAFEGQG